MKKLLSVLLLLSLLCACKQESLPAGVIVDPNAPKSVTTEKARPQSNEAAVQNTQEDQPMQEDPPQEPGEAFVFTAPNGTKILPLDKAEDILPLLGEAQSCFEADSCAYQGKDYYYYYPGFELTVNEIEGEKRITVITLADDTMKVPFEKGSLGLGDREATLLAVLGGQKEGSLYTYVSEDCKLQVEVLEGIVVNLLFKPLQETAGIEE